MALRLDLSGDPSASELVQRVKDTSLQAFEHVLVALATLDPLGVDPVDLDRAVLQRRRVAQADTNVARRVQQVIVRELRLEQRHQT